MVQPYVEQRDGGYYVKGSRVPLEAIVYAFRSGASPEAIRQDFATLTLEQVYGAITFYLGHQDEVEATLQDAEKKWAEFETAHPPPPELKEKLSRAREQITARRER